MELDIVFGFDPMLYKQLTLESGAVAGGETISCSCECSDHEAELILSSPRPNGLLFAIQRLAGVDRLVPYVPKLVAGAREGSRLQLQIELSEGRDEKGTTVSLPKDYA
jgi:hypothetical protein